VQIEGGDVARVAELVGVECINNIGHSIWTGLGRLEGSIRNSSRVVDFGSSGRSLRRSASSLEPDRSWRQTYQLTRRRRWDPVLKQHYSSNCKKKQAGSERCRAGARDARRSPDSVCPFVDRTRRDLCERGGERVVVQASSLPHIGKRVVLAEGGLMAKLRVVWLSAVECEGEGRTKAIRGLSDIDGIAILLRCCFEVWKGSAQVERKLEES
jgi:hypothetical protein